MQLEIWHKLFCRLNHVTRQNFTWTALWVYCLNLDGVSVNVTFSVYPLRELTVDVEYLY
jgi:hypothetical protein